MTVLLEEVSLIDGVLKIVTIFGDQVELTVVGPGVESVTHGVLRPNSHVLATSEKQKSVDLLVETLPVHDVRHPGEAGSTIEEWQGDLPGPEEGVDEEDVPREGHEAIIKAVGVFEVDSGVLNIVTRV